MQKLNDVLLNEEKMWLKLGLDRWNSNDGKVQNYQILRKIDFKFTSFKIHVNIKYASSNKSYLRLIAAKWFVTRKFLGFRNL